ncbi:MAG TPA: glycosyltransferase family 4 protein [Oligoflexus sp.]|uniref:glycosyltransferase family 4 protein n=1 Tax=Oligoflexus sp. TaxID=1971216 RepID=UPI002D57FB8A|nr:glycosyltransferase family 4 protein [Oligoflexus sp.]HYX39631.1 glycosyltransferase family 4 protein [Oligoflexus sp.]
MRIGYLVPEFPGQTHIFFWREICVLRKLDADLLLLSTRRPQMLSRHAFGPEALAETRYIFPPQFFKALFFLMSRPQLTLSMLRYIVNIEDANLRIRLRLLGLMLCAADLILLAREEKLEHIHGHSCADVAHLLALADQAGDLPYSLTLHGDLPVYGQGHRSKFARARFVACVTFALQKQVQDVCGLDPRRLPVIRMGVDVKKFRPGPARVGKPGILKLITVARLAECKGHIYAIRALKLALSSGLNATYTIVGDGEERAILEKEVILLELQSNVRMVGTAGEHEVLQFLHDADCFVLPSIGFGEAAPVSVMEAMACQLPVIASIIGGTPEMIQTGVNGILVQQRDVTGLAQAMLKIGADCDLRRALAQAARETAINEFSAEHFATELHKAILAKG